MSALAPDAPAETLVRRRARGLVRRRAAAVQSALPSPATSAVEAAGAAGAAEAQKAEAALERARQGDLGAFAELVMPYRALLEARVLPVAGDHATAADLVSEAILRGFERLAHYEDRHLVPWLARIAANLAISRVRRTRLQERLRTETPGPVQAAWDRRAAEDPSCAVERGERRERLAGAIAQLPERHRDILRERYLEGCSVQEIARDTDSSANAVSLVLHRARTALRAALEGL